MYQLYLVKLASGLLHEDPDDGQGLAEYALILGLIAMIAIVALLFMGNSISGALSFIGSTLQDKAGP